VLAAVRAWSILGMEVLVSVFLGEVGSRTDLSPKNRGNAYLPE